jgi:hypothetical protein
LWRGEKEEKKNQTKLKSGNREIMWKQPSADFVSTRRALLVALQPFVHARGVVRVKTRQRS